jgi:hypothetical protein
MFRIVMDKLFMERGKVEEVKSQKVRKNAENNGNKTLGLFKKYQYFGTYHIGRT